MKMYRYRLISTGASSHKYGPCKVCGEHATEVFSQVEERSYELPGTLEEQLEDAAKYRGGGWGWTHDGCYSLLGHKDCLVNRRR